MSVATSAKALRAFFRHAALRGWCAGSIAAGIDSPRLFQHEGLPTGQAWPDVQRLIASTGGDSPRDIRDRAILTLLTTYGLRSGEVAGLRLQDVDWDREIISISRPKPRRVQQYPLVREAGEAILRYLQGVRPRCERREIFLTLKPPFRQISQGALYHLVSKRLGFLGIHLARRGPHSRRHACAGHLMAEGFSLKQIGDHLGHRSVYPTRIYANVDLAGLREVADFDLGGTAMKLSVLTNQYVAYKQDMGMRFHTEARTLRSFCRTMGDIDVVEVTVQSVLAFIAGPGPVTPFWHRKHEVLRGFYRFATARGYAATSPLPKIIRQAPQFVPQIFSHEELQR